jgi:hypothetical protein
MSAFCGEQQKAEFERNVIRKRTLAGLKAARARRAPAGLPTGRREQASERDKLEACDPLRGLQLPGYRRWVDLQEFVNLLEAARGRAPRRRTDNEVAI